MVAEVCELLRSSVEDYTDSLYLLPEFKSLRLTVYFFNIHVSALSYKCQNEPGTIASSNWSCILASLLVSWPSQHADN
jgi:hypothetical protein